jgi:hypothetical protein
MKLISVFLLSAPLVRAAALPPAKPKDIVRVTVNHQTLIKQRESGFVKIVSEDGLSAEFRSMGRGIREAVTERLLTAQECFEHFDNLYKIQERKASGRSPN